MSVGGGGGGGGWGCRLIEFGDTVSEALLIHRFKHTKRFAQALQLSQFTKKKTKKSKQYKLFE